MVGGVVGYGECLVGVELEDRRFRFCFVICLVIRLWVLVYLLWDGVFVGWFFLGYCLVKSIIFGVWYGLVYCCFLFDFIEVFGGVFVFVGVGY